MEHISKMLSLKHSITKDRSFQYETIHLLKIPNYSTKFRIQQLESSTICFFVQSCRYAWLQPKHVPNCRLFLHFVLLVFSDIALAASGRFLLALRKLIRFKPQTKSFEASSRVRKSVQMTASHRKKAFYRSHSILPCPAFELQLLVWYFRVYRVSPLSKLIDCFSLSRINRQKNKKNQAKETLAK